MGGFGTLGGGSASLYEGAVRTWDVTDGLTSSSGRHALAEKKQAPVVRRNTKIV